MTHAVIWKLTAVQQLAAVSAAGVREAAARVDFTLRRTPRDMGESRDPGHRLWYEDVLGVYYRIDEAALRVEVLFVGPARR